MNSTRTNLFLSLAVLICTAIAWLSPFEALGSGYIDTAFKRAAAGFAIARGLNGVISVAQGTEFAVQPAGVGVSFTPGEILDPVNDLVERFSWIMLLATSSLGIQKVLLSMSSWHGLVIGLLIIGGGLLCVLWFRQLEVAWLRRILFRAFLFLLLLRFMMPAVSLANEWVYRTFLSDQYEQATSELETAREEISNINDEVLTSPAAEQNGGLVNRAKELYRSAVKQIDFERKLGDYRNAAETISTNTVELIVVFLMQTLVFPLLFLFVVYKLARVLLLGGR